jgi:hypothetical protein
MSDTTREPMTLEEWQAKGWGAPVLFVLTDWAADRKALVMDRDRYDLALQSLTPGGSEFVHDPWKCVDTVRALRLGDHDAMIRFSKEAAALRAERDELVKALREVDGYARAEDGRSLLPVLFAERMTAILSRYEGGT